MIERIERLERQVRGIEKDLNILVKSLPATSSPVEQEEHSPCDVIWKCSKCKIRLGLYDETVDELRIRYRDFVSYVRLGAGGSIRVVCRGCGELNALEYVEEKL